jgi:hypothetical protein
LEEVNQSEDYTQVTTEERTYEYIHGLSRFKKAILLFELSKPCVLTPRSLYLTRNVKVKKVKLFL